LSLRQLQTNAAFRVDEICHLVPSKFDPISQGIHTWCYESFTNVSKIKKFVRDRDEPLATAASGFRASTRSKLADELGSALLFPNNQCLFCGCLRKRRGQGHEELIKCVTECAERTIKDMANAKQDFELLGKIEGGDLRAREAHYHESCRRAYVRQDDRVHHSKKESEVPDNKYSSDQRAAYKKAFEFLCQYIDEKLSTVAA
jgi:hypothetical protein